MTEKFDLDDFIDNLEYYEVEEMYNNLSCELGYERILSKEEFEDEINNYFKQPSDLYNAIKFGDIDFKDDYITFNGYANLTSLTYADLKENLKDLLENNLNEDEIQEAIQSFQ